MGCRGGSYLVSPSSTLAANAHRLSVGDMAPQRGDSWFGCCGAGWRLRRCCLRSESEVCGAFYADRKVTTRLLSLANTPQTSASRDRTAQWTSTTKPPPPSAPVTMETSISLKLPPWSRATHSHNPMRNWGNPSTPLSLSPIKALKS